MNKICNNIYDRDHKIREATGKFISEVILERLVEYRLPAAQQKARRNSANRVGEDSTTSAHRLRLKSLVELVQQMADSHPDVADYSVDSLWGKTDSLLQWEVMTELLLTNSGDDSLSSDQFPIMARLLNLSVRKACGDVLIEGGKSTDKEFFKNVHVQDLTVHLSKTLPALLNKFSANPTVAAFLVELPRFFPLDAFASFRLKSHLQELLKHLSDLFLKSVDSDIFDHVARTFTYLAQEHAYQRDVDVAFQEVVETSTRRFREAQDQANRSKGEGVLLIATQRITALAGYDSSLHRRDDNLFADVLSLLEARLEARGPRRGSSPVSDVPEEVAALCIEVSVHQIVWELSKIVPSAASAKKTAAKKRAAQPPAADEMSVEEPSSAAPVDDSINIPDSQLTQDSPAGKPGETTAANKAAIDRVEEMSRRLFKVLPTIFTSDISDSLREIAFRQVCWLLVAFTPSLAVADPSLAPVVYSCEADLASQLQAFYDRNMSTPTDNDDEVDRKLALTQAFGATVVKNVLSHRSYDFAPSLLVHFVQHDQIITEAIKTILQQLRENFADHEKDYILGTLQRSFKAATIAVAHLNRKEEESASESISNKKKSTPKKKKPAPRTTEDTIDEDEIFSSFSRLSQRLADSYGIRGNIRGAARLALYEIVLRGLKFALADDKERARFVSDGLMPFVSKLDNAAAGSVLQNILSERAIGRLYSALDENDDDLSPFFQVKEACSRMSHGDKPTGRKAANPRSARKSKVARQQEDEEESDVADSPSEGDEDSSDGLAKKTAAASRPRRQAAPIPTKPESADSDSESSQELPPSVTRKRSSRVKPSTALGSPVTHKRSEKVDDEEGDAPSSEDDSESEEILHKRSKSKSKLPVSSPVASKRSKRARASDIAPLYADDPSSAPKPSQDENDDNILEPALSKRPKRNSTGSASPSQSKKGKK